MGRTGAGGRLTARVNPAAVAWVGLAAAIALASVAWLGSSRVALVVPHDRAPEIVALFGEAWRRPTGDFRIVGGRMEGGVVRVFLAAPGVYAAMTLEHARARQAVPPGAVVVEHPGGDAVVVLTCEPACGPESIEHLRALATQVLLGDPGRLWVTAAGFATGRERVVACALAAGVCVAAALFGVVALWRAWPPAGGALADAVAVGGLTAAATALLGKASVANWYSNNLPGTGGVLEAADQNGVAGFFLQVVVGTVVPWTDGTLFGLNFVLHAIAGGAFYLAFRALALARREAFLAMLLWAVQPLAVRIGWSDAQHVQVQLLFALLLLVWLRAQFDSNWPERLLGPLLAALLPWVRLEAAVLAPLPLLFGPLVGDRSWSRRLLDTGVYGMLLVLSVAAIFELFVRRYDMPLPDLSHVLAAAGNQLVHLRPFTQLLAVGSGMPNWLPLPMTALVALGAVVLAIRQPLRLAAVLVAFLAPQLLLDRLMNAEGMVGARYFMPLLAWLAMVAGAGLAALAAGLRDLLAPRLREAAAPVATGVVAVLGAGAVVFASMPLYRHEYSFQAEQRFLRAALAALPADAVVLHLPVREDDEIRNDPDCCLDLPNSPLALAFPGLRFEAIPLRGEGARLPAAVDARTYYYEGALCHLAPIPESERRNPGLSAMVREQCATLARDPRLEPVAAARVSSDGFWPFLPPGGVPVRLLRVRPR
ncbi:hypothetical protein L6Q96_21905 [Candidatus Binatia bacterium]|nr:hypothetical protein [Candidatus Binatia bacterium]